MAHCPTSGPLANSTIHRHLDRLALSDNKSPCRQPLQNPRIQGKRREQTGTQANREETSVWWRHICKQPNQRGPLTVHRPLVAESPSRQPLYRDFPLRSPASSPFLSPLSSFRPPIVRVCHGRTRSSFRTLAGLQEQTNSTIILTNTVLPSSSSG